MEKLALKNSRDNYDNEDNYKNDNEYTSVNSGAKNIPNEFTTCHC